jgi:predicted nucleic acid-binding protein
MEVIGVDTSFLIGLTVKDHPAHDACWTLFESEILGGDATAIAPQVLAEFCHVVTDNRRFEYPLAMSDALDLVSGIIQVHS